MEMNLGFSMKIMAEEVHVFIIERILFIKDAMFLEVKNIVICLALHVLVLLKLQMIFRLLLDLDILKMKLEEMRAS